ncbi:MAG: hypothetical protein HY360_04005 [Verrucomicrobia bacterium]|nr:hypothetical protein [Verrucomicrobiota bacterium]
MRHSTSLEAKTQTRCGLQAMLFLLLSTASLHAAEPAPPGDDYKARGILFHLPFDDSLDAAYAQGRAQPLCAKVSGFVEGKKGRAVWVEAVREDAVKGKIRDWLTYDALANVYPDRGTLSFWLKPFFDCTRKDFFTGASGGGPPILTIKNTVQDQLPLFWMLFRKLRFEAGIFDRNQRFIGCQNYAKVLAADGGWTKDSWRHLVWIWDCEQGTRFYDNGELAFSNWGKTTWPPKGKVDRIIFGSGLHWFTPWIGADAAFDEFMIFREPLEEGQVKLLYQLADPIAAGIPPKDRPLSDLTRETRKNELSFAETEALPVLESAQEGKARILQGAVTKLRASPPRPYRMTMRGVLDGNPETTCDYWDAPNELRFGFEGKPRVDYAEIQGAITDAALYRDDVSMVALKDKKGPFVHIRLPQVETDHLLLKPTRSTAIREIQFFRLDAPNRPPHDGVTGFLRRPMPDELPPETARRLLLFWDAADRQCLMAFPDSSPAAPAGANRPALGVPALRNLNLFSAPASEDLGIAAVTLNLNMKTTLSNALVRVSVKDPFYYRHRNAFAITLRCPATPSASKEESADGDHPTLLRLALSTPGLLLPKGERLWIEAAFDRDVAVQWGGDSGSALTLHPCATRDVLAEFTESHLRLLHSPFMSMFSYRDNYPDVFQQSECFQGLQTVLKYDPENETARAMVGKATGKFVPMPIKVETPPNCPQWAADQRELLRQLQDIVLYWVLYKQDEEGSFGGHGSNFNDDVELIVQFHWLPLVTDDDRVRRALARLADGWWKGPNQVDGYSGQLTDAEHAAEEPILSQPVMLLHDYGNPVYFEHCMKTASLLDKWTGINAKGHRHFRSNYFNAQKMLTDGNYGREWSGMGEHFCPALWMAWYNHNPLATRIFTENATAWLEDAMREDASGPVSVIPQAVAFATDAIQRPPGKDAWYMDWLRLDQMVAAFFLTGDRKFFQPLEYGFETNPYWQRPHLAEFLVQWRKTTADRRFDDRFIEEADKWMTTHEADTVTPYADDEMTPYLAWVVTRDKRFLEAALESKIKASRRTRFFFTEAAPPRDRVYLKGIRLLSQMYLGGKAPIRSTFPDIAVSWLNSGDNFAGLFLENDRKHLRVLLYNFEPKPKRMQARVWQLENGRYQVRVGPDANGDDRMDQPTQKFETDLSRGAAVEFDLPPGKPCVVEIQQLQAGADNIANRPDLAISAADVRALPDQLQVEVTVHNIGSVEAKNVVVRLVGQKKETLGEAVIPSLAAPNDLTPKTAVVSIPLRENTDGKLAVLVDPDNRIPEITEDNNRMELSP